jgi:hypothetical protein
MIASNCCWVVAMSTRSDKNDVNVLIIDGCEGLVEKESSRHSRRMTAIRGPSQLYDDIYDCIIVAASFRS